MKKKIFSGICLSVLLTVSMTGCSSNISNMTDAQRTEISEYAAKLLLKYNTNTSSRLVNVEELYEEPSQTPRPTPQATGKPQEDTGMEPTEDTPVMNPGKEGVTGLIDINTVLGLPETISLQYSSYDIQDSYEDVLNNGLVIEAAEDNKLLVCEFVLINDGAEKQSVDMLKDNIIYTMQIGKNTKPCSVTMLSNDLTTYLGILNADESRRVVVMAEVEESMLAETEGIVLKMQREDLVTSINIR